jgi:hypothetical protein
MVLYSINTICKNLNQNHIKTQELVMKSKVLLLAIATSVFALSTSAQEKTTFGLRAGVNFQNVDFEYLGEKAETKLKTGFHVGVNAEIPIAPEFYIQPGLLFSTKGAKADEGDGKFNLSYVEVPVNFLYKGALGSGKILLGVGPYIGIGVGGKIKGDDGQEDGDIKFTNDVEAGDNDAALYLKRLDFGGNLLAGYELSSKLSFQLNAQLGMANLIPKFGGEKLDDTKFKNTGFGISVGYRF